MKKWLLLLGNSESGCFDLNVGKTKQQEIFNFFKNSNRKMFHDKAKHFISEDMKYIINSRGKHLCQKTKVHEFAMDKNMMLCHFTPVNCDITSFPGTTQYNNMYVIERTVFKMDNYQVILRTVDHGSTVTFEVRLEGGDKDELLSIAEELGFSMKEQEMKSIEHGAYYVLSVL